MMKFSTMVAAGVLAVGVVLVPIPPASAVVTIFTDFGSGNLDVDYGGTGAATLSAFYRLPSGTVGSSGVAAASGLGFSALVSGNTTGQLQVTYDLSNTTSAVTAPLKFFAEVDPDGDLTNNLDIPGSTIVAGPGEPSRYSLDDFNSLSFHLDSDIQVNGQLDNLNSCGPFCDVVFAFQWDIPALNPGEIARVVVSLSDTGARLSDSFLTATHADTGGNIVLPEQVLTFSGQLQVIPEPQTWALLCAGLGLLGLGLLRRRV